MLETGFLVALEPTAFYSQVFANALPPLHLSSPTAHRNLLPSCETIANVASKLSLPDAQRNNPVRAMLPSVGETLQPSISRESLLLGRKASTPKKLGKSRRDPSFSWLQQARGRDGRFLPKGVVPCDIGEKERKKCGWCGTLETTQWRAGPSGSIEMSVLCNACGISYRRALAKGHERIDLQKLALEKGPLRSSIQKSLNRRRRLSASGKNCKLANDENHTKNVGRQPCWLRRILCFDGECFAPCTAMSVMQR